MYCKCCGKKLDAEDRFCSFCGSPVEKEETLDSVVSDLNHTEELELTYKQINALQKDRFEEEWEREERKERFTFMIFGVLIVVLIIAITGGVSFLIQKEKDKSFASDIGNMGNINIGNNSSVGGPNQESTNQTDAVITPALIIPSEVLTDDTSENQREEEPGKTNKDTSEYVIADSDVRYLVSADLKELSAWEIRVARNEIYARHGRMFDSPELRAYFESKSWYKPEIPAVEFNNSCLSAVELENLNFIINYEKAHNLN